MKADTIPATIKADKAKKAIRAGGTSSGGVPVGSEPGDDECRGAARLPEGVWVGVDVVGDCRSHRQPDQQPEGSEQADGK